MKKALKILGLALGVVLIGGVGYLAASSGLKSDPAIGLSPETHKMGRVDVRAFTPAPLGAEVFQSSHHCLSGLRSIRL